VEGNAKAKDHHQLGLIISLAHFYVEKFYEHRKFARFLAMLGIHPFNIEDRAMDRAANELSDVDYDLELWKERYKNNW
jgi:hypothetical protein